MRRINIRYRLIYIIFTIVWVVLIARVYMLSINANEYFSELALKNIERTDVLVPLRGWILDRNNEPLAINELGFKIAIKAHLSKKSLDGVLDELSRYFTIKVEDMRKLYIKENSPYNHDPISVIDFVSYAEMESLYPILLQNDLLKIIYATKRLYLYNNLAAHTIGYIGAANEQDIERDKIAKYTGVVGRSGIERQYNDYLQGNIGYKKIIVNAYNEEIKVLKVKQATKQHNIVLSLDIRLQNIMNELFADKAGAAVIMDAQNGEILAAGSYPNYDLNMFVGGISSDNWSSLRESLYAPLLNKLIKGLYPPGSVIKMGVALSFLNNNVIDERTKIDTPGFIMVGGHKFRDWKKGGHGMADMTKALKESIDVYFYKVAQLSGMAPIAKDLKRYGLGSKSGVDIPNEFVGTVPSPEWKKKRYNAQWFTGDTINTSIGQGAFLTTPMQIARYTALMATGRLITPHFARYFGKVRASFETKDVLSKLEKEKIAIVREGMYEVCNAPNGGTAYWRTRGSKVVLACKTGTAQVVSIPQSQKNRMKESDMEYFHRSHGWITAFLPFKNPKYVITIMVEHGEGGSKQGPLLVKLANTLKELGYLK